MSESLPISVVIPTYNRSARTLEAVNSVLEQHAPPTELWVVDDGSTDDTAARIQERIATAGGPTKIHYLHQQNAGVSAARNLGISRSRQPWIAFLDSDDRWLPKKLQRQWDAHLAASTLRLWHSNEIWIRRGVRVNQKKKHQKRGGEIFLHCLPLCCISPSAAMIHRSVFFDVGLFDEGMLAGEDYDLWLRICAREAVGYVDEALLLKYGGHDDQLSTAHWGMDRFRVFALEKLLLDPDDPLRPNQREAAHDCLRKKLEILLQGALKRDRGWLALRCRKKLAFWKEHRPPGDQGSVPRQPVLLQGEAS